MTEDGEGVRVFWKTPWRHPCSSGLHSASRSRVMEYSFNSAILKRRHSWYEFLHPHSHSSLTLALLISSSAFCVKFYSSLISDWSQNTHTSRAQKGWDWEKQIVYSSIRQTRRWTTTTTMKTRETRTWISFMALPVGRCSSASTLPFDPHTLTS